MTYVHSTVAPRRIATQRRSIQQRAGSLTSVTCDVFLPLCVRKIYYHKFKESVSSTCLLDDLAEVSQGDSVMTELTHLDRSRYEGPATPHMKFIYEKRVVMNFESTTFESRLVFRWVVLKWQSLYGHYELP